MYDRQKVCAVERDVLILSRMESEFYIYPAFIHSV